MLQRTAEGRGLWCLLLWPAWFMVFFVSGLFLDHMLKDILSIMCSAWGGSVPTDQEKRVFVDELVADQDHRGRIVVCNVVDGHAEGHLMKIDVKQYFEWWIDLCEHLDRCEHQRLKSIRARLAAMNTLRNGKYPSTFKAGEKRPDFRFRCPKRRPRKQTRFRELCSTVPALVLREVIDDTTGDPLTAEINPLSSE